MRINDKTPVIFRGECNCSKPRATNEGNGHQQNPGQQTRGTRILKTPGNKRGEWPSSKPRATNGGNAKLQNPGPLMGGMELPGTPVKDMSPGSQNNKTPGLCMSNKFPGAKRRRKTPRPRHQLLEGTSLAPTRSFASPARTHETKRFPGLGGALKADALPLTSDTSILHRLYIDYKSIRHRLDID